MNGDENNPGITAEDTIRDLKRVTARCMQDVQPMFDRAGKPIMAIDENGKPIGQAYAFNAMAALKAIELAGKHNGAFTERVDVNHTSNAALLELTTDGDTMDSEKAARLYRELFK